MFEMTVIRDRFVPEIMTSAGSLALVYQNAPFKNKRGRI